MADDLFAGWDELTAQADQRALELRYAFIDQGLSGTRERLQQRLSQLVGERDKGLGRGAAVGEAVDQG
jgi:hypothetical protein